MGYSIKWLIEQRVIFVEVSDILELRDARLLSQEITEHVAAGESPVHLMVELRNLLLSPSNIQLNQEMTAPYLNHPNMGWVILIGGNMIMRFVGTVLSRLMKMNLKQVETYEQAVDALKAIDPSIDERSIK